MLTKLFSSFILSFFVFYNCGISAVIVETQRVEDILTYVQDDSFVLFNITEVLTDSQMSLGTSKWRHYLKQKLAGWNGVSPYNIHDVLTFAVAHQVPQKSVEEVTPSLIRSLQDHGIAVAALTARGRDQWYSTRMRGVDNLTETILEKLGIDFSRSSLPFVSIQMEGAPFLQHFRKGIFYAYPMDDGAFLKQLLENSGYCPANVVLVNDKRDSLEDVEAAMQELGIPFVGFWYTRTAHDHKNFVPMIAHVQLQALSVGKAVMTDAEAQKIIAEKYSDTDPEQFFNELLDSMLP